MKKQSRRSTTVTEIASRRSRSRQAVTEGAPTSEGVVLSIASRSRASSMASPDLAESVGGSRKDRAAEFLAELGLADCEIAVVREAVPVVPFDTELVGRCRAFVTANLHGWDHATWLAFVDELATDGYAIGTESGRWWLAQKFVGSLLEAIRAAEMAAIADQSSSLLEARAA